jgi:hypothetical protein
MGARRVRLAGLVNVNRPDDLPSGAHGSSKPAGNVLAIESRKG